MSRVGRIRILVCGASALLCALTVLASPSAPSGASARPAPRLATAADTSAFQAGNIVSDAVFYDSGSMTATDVQAFLNAKGANCQATGGVPCLKDYTMATPDEPADAYCPRAYAGAASESAASIIAKVAAACGISPRVLLVTLQKEQALVTRSGPTDHVYQRAMGYGCADSMNGGCSAYYPGLFNQLYFAAKQFKRYAANPTGYSFVPRMNNYVAWNPDPACGTGVVLIQNQATASLYNYTPYQPNAAALSAGYGLSANGCASYGNRNFWLYFTDWFGSTQTMGRDVDAPVGTLDGASGGAGVLNVSGWAYDPNVVAASVAVHVYVDGVYAGALTADASRPDVGAAYPGVGNNHGYSGSVPAAEGQRTACVYAINQGAGYTNPLLGCLTVQVGQSRNPIGNVDSVSTSGRTLSVAGWAWDPDVPTTPLTVHIYVNGQWGGAVTANVNRPDVGLVYPAAGPVHGFTWSTQVSAPGNYTVCAFGINQGAGTTNPQLACRQVTVSAAPWNPIGSLDSISVSGRAATLSGWALDGDAGTSPVAVHVYVDGAWAGAYTANTSRPDVGAVYAGAGPNHGFAIPVEVPGGSHQVCAYLINAGYGSTNPLLACRTVTIDPAAWNPFGSVDNVSIQSGALKVSGWVIDPDKPLGDVTVHVYVDGYWGGLTVADGARPDVGLAYASAGAQHGYALSLPVASGRHTVCVYAINVGSGSTNPLIACRVVTS